jgi:MFS family permease
MTADSSNSTPAPAWKRIGRSLHHRNFRLFFLGQGISLIGTWMQQLAMSWLVYLLTRDVFLLGVVNFAGQIPAFVLVPLAGVLIDHWNRHRLLVITQTLMMFQALVLTVLTWLDIIDISQLILLSVFMGCVNAFDMPARQAFMPEMLTHKDDLGNAIALNSSLFHGARLIGPFLAGFTIAWAGAKICFLLNALSFLAVIVALLRMDVRPAFRPARRESVAHGLREGLGYALGFAPIRAILLLVAAVSLFGMPYTVLMPVVADTLLDGGPRHGATLLGWLMTASGLGALAGAVTMALRQTVLGLGAKIVMGCALFSGGLMVFAESRLVWLSLLTLVVSGFGMMVMMASCNTILQTIVDDDKRGRVMSLYTMAFMGLAPFGSLLAGSIASAVGTHNALLLCGVSSLAAGLVFGARRRALRRLVRPIYRQRGILPEAASGLRPVQDLCESTVLPLRDPEMSGQRSLTEKEV